MSIPDNSETAQRKEEMRRQWTGRAALFRDRETTMLQPATDLLLAALRTRTDMHVLDVASGPGEPAITLAAAIAPDGHVTATDLVPEMLTVAAEKAEKRGVTNITFQQADAEALPFPDAAFDAVTCRFGVMLFADVQRGLGEMRRVLKPGGQIVCVVWGPRERDPMTRSLAVVRHYVELPPPHRRTRRIVSDSPNRGPSRSNCGWRASGASRTHSIRCQCVGTGPPKSGGRRRASSIRRCRRPSRHWTRTGKPP